MSELMHDGTPRSGLSHGTVGEMLRTRLEVLRALRELNESLMDVHVTGSAARLERVREAIIAAHELLGEWGMTE